MHPDKQLQVFFQDEARFGQQGTLTRLWSRRGQRATAVRQTQYDYLYVVGAACPATGQAEAIMASHINTDVINAFFREFAKTIADDVHVVMIWDGAGFHRSGTLSIPDNITVLQLPAYSPELNPIENLWHYLRSHHWSNRVYANYDDLMQAAITAWQASALDPEIIQSVCNATYVESAVNC